MHLQSSIATIALLLCTGTTAAQDTAPQTDAIAISSEEQALRLVVELDAPLSEVWTRFTTDDGVRSWMVPVGEVDLRSGGAIRSNYDPCASLGDEGTITLDIVNYVPEKFLLLRTDLGAATDAPWMNAAILERSPHMSNLIQFESIDAERTRVTSWGLGYGTGEEWDQMIGFFVAGNSWSFTQLQRALAGEQVFSPCDTATD